MASSASPASDQLPSGVANPLDIPGEDNGDVVGDEWTGSYRERPEQRARIPAQRPEPLADEV